MLQGMMKTRCLDIMSTHVLTTDDYDPNVTTSDFNDLKMFDHIPHQVPKVDGLSVQPK
jgi:hypothetical protein